MAKDKSTNPASQDSSMPVVRSFRCSTVANSFRTGSLLDEEVLIVPLTAVKGDIVWTPMGSKGPEFVPASVLADNPQQWNNRPVIFDHPVSEEGELISARDPEILDAQQYGAVYNAKIVDNDLNIEIWLSPSRAKAVGPKAEQVLTDIRTGKSVETSVGGMVLIEEKSGTSPSGVSYEFVIHRLVSDHLAAGLDGTKGACSVEDGCGVQSNADANPDTDSSSVEVVAAESGPQPPLEPSTSPTLVMRASERQTTDGLLVRTLRAALRAAQERTVTDDSVELVDDAVEAVQTIEFKPAKTSISISTELAPAPAQVQEPKPEKDHAMNKGTLIDKLITSDSTLPWTESNREMLSALTEEQLTALAASSGCDCKGTDDGKEDSTLAAGVEPGVTTPAIVIPPVTTPVAEPTSTSTMVQVPADKLAKMEIAANAYGAHIATVRAATVARIIACEGSKFTEAKHLDGFDDEALGRLAQSLAPEQLEQQAAPTFPMAVNFEAQGLPIAAQGEAVKAPPSMNEAVKSRAAIVN